MKNGDDPTESRRRRKGSEGEKGIRMDDGSRGLEFQKGDPILSERKKEWSLFMTRVNYKFNGSKNKDKVEKEIISQNALDSPLLSLTELDGERE